MNFNEAELLFRGLEQARREGRISAEAYQQQLANLRVKDASGATWQMQAETGKWFVFRAGQWQPAAPPAAPKSLVKSPVPVSPSAAPVKQPRRTGKTGLFLLALVGFCLVCSALAAGGYYLYESGQLASIPLLELLDPKTQPAEPGQTGQSEPAEAENIAPPEVKPLGVITVAADGSSHSDANGVSLTVSAGTLPEQSQVELTAHQLDAAWVNEIQKNYTLDTPFYTVAVQGAEDSTGRMALTFPAASPDSRLVAVIDGQFLVETSVLPKEGQLTLDVRSGATQPDSASPFVGESSNSIYFVTLTPRQSSQTGSAEHLARLQDDRFCMPDNFEGIALNICRKNPAGSILVTLPLGKENLLPQVDQMVDQIDSVMTQYANLKFESAKISPSSPMIVRVFTGKGDPSYKPQNGVLYIPEDVVANIASGERFSLYHEMAHWIQDEEYAMIPAYYSNPRQWWLEVSAETMVMMLDSSYVNKNLTTYGSVTHENSALVLQSSPYQWPGDFYVQAQLVRLNVCDGQGCALTTEGFAKAISAGEYPLMDESKQALISKNIDDYARYLLGKVPQTANTAIPLGSAVSSGTGYGESANVMRTSKKDLDYLYDGSDPQMRKVEKDGKTTLAVEAKIQKDGVYPFIIKPAEEKYAALPVMLEIQPGAPFYYSLNNGEVQYSDGTKELKIQPIHVKLGYSQVRIVAMGKDGEKVFKASLQPVDLTGTWVIFPDSLVENNAQCQQTGDSETEGSLETLGVVFIHFISSLGEMQPQPNGLNYDWSLVSGRLPPESDSSDFTYTGLAKMEQGVLRYDGNLNVPKQSESSLPSPGAVGWVVAAAFFPLIWWGRKHPHSRLPVLLSILLLLALAGCFGMAIYGQTGVKVDYDAMEYLGGEDTGTIAISTAPKGTPLWKIRGVATYTVNNTIETSITDIEGNEQVETNTCTGTLKYRVTTYIYKDVVIVTDDGE